MLNDGECQAIYDATLDTEPYTDTGNSKLYRVAVGGKAWAVKVFTHRPNSLHTPSQREFASYKYVHESRLEFFPQLGGFVHQHQVLIVEWVNGSASPKNRATTSFMKKVIKTLGSTRRWAPTRIDPLATDAALSLPNYLAQIRKRLASLSEASDGQFKGMLAKLRSHVEILQPEESRVCTKKCVGLSISDFGNQNIIWNPSTQSYVVIDLEYFGLDDLHKHVAETWNHPQNLWMRDADPQWLDSCAADLELCTSRLRIVELASRIKWATIIMGRVQRGAPTSVALTSDASHQSLDEDALEVYWQAVNA